MNIKDFYTLFPYPDIEDTYPLGVKNYRSLSAPRDFQGNILVIGCGTAEAVIIANKNPKSIIYGIDISEKSLEISKNLAKTIPLNNIVLDNKDITEYSEKEKFHYVVSSCVLHHIENVSKAINNIYDSLCYDGKFSGSVYSSNRPKYIRDIKSKEFSSLDELRTYFKHNPNDWYLSHQKNDSELADTWLNPYWRDYDHDLLSIELKKFRNLQIYEENYKLYFYCMK